MMILHGFSPPWWPSAQLKRWRKSKLFRNRKMRGLTEVLKFNFKRTESELKSSGMWTPLTFCFPTSHGDETVCQLLGGRGEGVVSSSSHKRIKDALVSGLAVVPLQVMWWWWIYFLWCYTSTQALVRSVPIYSNLFTSVNFCSHPFTYYMHMRTHMFTSVHILSHICTSIHICSHPFTSIHICSNPFTSVHIPSHLFTSVHIYTDSRVSSLLYHTLWGFTDIFIWRAQSKATPRRLQWRVFSSPTPIVIR